MESREAFVWERRGEWQQLSDLLPRVGSRSYSPDELSHLARLYRSAASDLMAARAKRHGRDVEEHLEALVSRAHNVLYGARRSRLGHAGDYLFRCFPRTVRQLRWAVLSAALLFVVPLIIGYLVAHHSDEWAQLLLPPAQLEQMENSYAEQASGRSEGLDAQMTGFYIMNNVGIAFRCFATGIFFGFGSIFFLFTNGLQIGAVAGFLARKGLLANLLLFTASHGPYELTAIVLAGAAGLHMGYSLLVTKGRTRLGSLRSAAPQLVAMIVGSAFMLFIAALIEGFWSPSSIPPIIKYAFAALSWAGVLLWLTLGGRGTPTTRELVP